MAAAARQGCQLAIFPELGLTVYSCADLFSQTLLLDQAARAALEEIAAASANHDIAAVSGCRCRCWAGCSTAWRWWQAAISWHHPQDVFAFDQ